MGAVSTVADHTQSMLAGEGDADRVRSSAEGSRLTGLVRRLHVWFGLATALGVIAISVTGILLNHRIPFGLGREGPPPVTGTGDIDDVLSLNDLMRRAIDVGRDRGLSVVTPRGDVLPASGPSDVSRVMLRPGTATAQVLLADPRATEVTLDWSTAEVLAVAPRDDVTIERVHSGEVVSQRGVIVADIVAGVLVLLMITGVWSWIQRLRSRRKAVGARASTWLRANWWFHLAGGLVVAGYLVVLSVTGVILNHKREWGFMNEPFRTVSSDFTARNEPDPLATIVARAIDARGPRAGELTVDNVRFIDYRPANGYAKVRFKDAETEVIVDIGENQVYSVSSRRDVWIEDLHSGLWFGSHGWLLSDTAAILLILLSVNGIYVWIQPTWRARGRVRAGQ